MKFFKFFLLAFIFNFLPDFLYAQQAWIDYMIIRDSTTNSAVGDSINGPRIEFERHRGTYPDDALKLCVKINCKVADSTMTFGIDQLDYEIFKFGSGSNPYDPASTPPIRTISLYSVGTCGCMTKNAPCGTTPPEKCVVWDGSYNLNGITGKTNGEFGFRATVKTNYTSEQVGNIVIQQTSAYPGENQKPMVVDVTNIHLVRSTPTVVGKITGVGAQPYNILYRLSKSANVSIKIYDPSKRDPNGPTISTKTLVRTLIDNLPRVGEGTPDGTLSNGDFWDGRGDNGQMLSSGTYIASIDAVSTDTIGVDLAYPYWIDIAHDPLQITDIAIKPLGKSATDVAMLSFMLTEQATVYLDIYTPDTYFSNINCAGTSDTCGYTGTRLKRIVEEKDRRQTVSMYWDGRDDNGNILCDGNYVFAISAVMPGNGANGKIWTSRLNVGVLPISRGNPLSFLSPSSSVIGSTPSAAGLDPFYFRYNLYRPGLVSLDILDTSTRVVRSLIKDQNRSSGLTNVEIWDGKDENGLWVSSGTYYASLTIKDPYQCVSASTFTHKVDFTVDMFRIVDVKASPIIGISTQAAVSYTLSQSMWSELKIYKPNIYIKPSDWPWTGSTYTDSNNIVYSISGMRQGREKITEYWDGSDKMGNILEDGRYPFTLIAYSTGTQTMYATDKAYGYIDVARGNIIFVSNDSIKLSFNHPSGAKSYEIEASSVSSFGAPEAIITSATVNTYATFGNGGVGTLIPNTTYYFRVKAYFDDEQTGYAELGSTVTLANKPTGFDFVDVYVSSLSFVWNANENPDGTKYKIRYRKERDIQDIAVIYSTEVSKITITNIESSTTYYFYISAINHLGISTDEISISTVTNILKIVDKIKDDGGSISFEDKNIKVNLNIPQSSFDNKEITVTVKLPDANKVDELTNAKSITGDVSVKDIFVEINTGGIQPKKPVEIVMDYPSSVADPDKLVIARYDDVRGVWIPLKSYVDKANKKIRAYTDHFSVFGILSVTPASTISDPKVAPNPLRPSKGAGYTSMTFSNLPANVEVIIYSVSGVKIKKLTTDSSGIALWDGKNEDGKSVASGVYFALIKNGSSTKTIKIGVQR